ncbi:FecR family protein [Sphingomonas sp. CLY1604]|uniref:FecR family protein n=1 Tax=Sphingomonas sp. CLY1604 TaxID=3457786 RepID=UPI003FD8940D
MTPRQKIEDRAAQWLIRRDQPGWGSMDQAELDTWLDQSMAHKAAFWRLEQGWRDADRVAAVPPPRPHDQIRAPALPLAVRTWQIPLALAASFAVLMAIPPSTRTRGSDAQHRFDTRIGQARTIATADGSRIELNTATTLRTRILAKRRDAWLDRGEAFFDIHHEGDRPFVVHAGSKTITVLGTRFSVRRDGGKVTVAVVSGRVRIDDAVSPSAATHSSTVAAGDVAVTTGPSTLVTAGATERLETLTAWRDGMVMFDQTPLGDAVREMNRYRTLPIAIHDPEIARFRIGGSFRSDNSEGFLRLLANAYGLKVTRTADAISIER